MCYYYSAQCWSTNNRPIVDVDSCCNHWDADRDRNDFLNERSMDERDERRSFTFVIRLRRLLLIVVIVILFALSSLGWRRRLRLLLVIRRIIHQIVRRTMRLKAIVEFRIPMIIVVAPVVISIIIARSRSSWIVVIVPMGLTRIGIVLLTRLMMTVIGLRCCRTFRRMRNDRITGIGIIARSGSGWCVAGSTGIFSAGILRPN